MSKLTLAAVQTLIKEHTKTLMDEISALRAEVKSLRSSFDAAQIRQSSVPIPSASDAASQKRFAKAVKTSVQFALRDEDAKKEVIVTMPERKRDVADVDDLCSKAEVTVKPSSITRLGKQETDRPRPLKASFTTSFDARAFMAKIEAYKKRDDPDSTMARVRCRPCRTHDEQSRYTALNKEVRKLNESAKSNGLDESYSIRHNGEVWKFTKTADGWKRALNWTFVPSTPATTSHVHFGPYRPSGWY